jgi:hypothetical protein
MTLLDAHNHINKVTTSVTLLIGTSPSGTQNNDNKILLMRLTWCGGVVEAAFKGGASSR